MEVLGERLGRYGRPASLHSDKHSVFRVNLPGREGELTQLTRALKALDIEAIHANTPQAKGGVERANRTLQNRPVKLMRLEGVNDIGTANAWAPGCVEKYKARFATEPAEPANAHRPAPHNQEEPALILCPHHERALSRDLTFRLHNRMYQAPTPGKGYGLRGVKVTVCEGWDGNVTAFHRGESPPRATARRRGAAGTAG